MKFKSKSSKTAHHTTDMGKTYSPETESVQKRSYGRCQEQIDAGILYCAVVKGLIGGKR
jgi:hypothetical protein